MIKLKCDVNLLFFLFIFLLPDIYRPFFKKHLFYAINRDLELFFDVFLKGLFESAAAEIGIGHISYYILKISVTLGL